MKRDTARWDQEGGAAQNPRVSIIMPARDVAPYIREAVDSVIRQTVTSWELIVVDDGSRDATIETVSPVKDPRVRVVCQAHEGLPEARNRGILESGGACLAFLDGDDAWKPQKLERHLAVLDARADIDLTFSHSVIIDTTGRPVPGLTRRGAGVLSYRDLLVENLIRSCSAVVLRAAALRQAGRFDPAFRICSDYEMWLRIGALRPRNIYCIPEPLTSYRSRPGQLSRRGACIEREWYRILRGAVVPTGREGGRTLRRARVNLSRYLAFLAYREGTAAAGLRHLGRGLRTSPGSFLGDPRNWAATVACLGKLLLSGSFIAKVERGFSRYTLP